MYSICYICLRSDRNLQTSEEELEHLYEELCEFDNENGCKFCSECIYKLKKYSAFKKTCILAAKKFKLWKRQRASTKKPIGLLYTEMPPAQLSRSIKNNFKLYRCMETDSDTAGAIEISSSKHPHIVTVNIPEDKDTINIPKGNSQPCETRSELIEIVIDKEIIKQEDVEFTEIDGNDLRTLLNFNVNADDDNAHIQIKDELNSDDDDDIDEDGDGDTSDEIKPALSDKEVDSDSDESLKELASLKDFLSKIKQENTQQDKVEVRKEGKIDDITLSNEDTKVNKVSRKRKTIDKDNLKNLLRKKFERFGVVKDDKGTVIDIELVISNLDSFTVRFLRTINKFCLRPGPFQPNDIRILSRIQARFPYTSVFKITCLHDNEAQMKAEFEKRQEYTEYANSNYRCESCLKAFKCAKMVDYHNKIQHDPSLPVECSLCHSRFSTKLMLYKHTASSHAMVYDCKLCDFITNYKSLMLKHYEKHKGSARYHCKQCDQDFSFSSQLYLHINKVHGCQYICELCASAFHNANGLKQHKIRKHERNSEQFVENERNTKCEDCNILFITEVVYRKHLKISHSEEVNETRKTRKYVCHLCDWEGCNLASRKEHYVTEHSMEDYNFKKSLHNLKRHLCETCGKAFTNITVYRDHLNTHTGLRPYACTMCDKAFHSAQCLQMHKERHLPPSRECKICGKKYNSVTNLIRHKKIHTNLKQYKCDICGKVFLQDYLLKQHINGVHFDGYKKKKN